MNAKRILKNLAMLAAVTAFGAVTIQADTYINVDFKSTNGGGGATYTGLAADPSDPAGASAFWNSNFFNNGFDNHTTLASSGGLLDSDGITNSGINISVPTFGGFTGTGSNNMLTDFVYTNAGNAQTISITGLSASLQYNIYLYSMGDATDQGASFTLNGLTQVASNNPRDGSSFNLGGNYVEFTGFTGSTTATINWTDNGVNDTAALNGIQIVAAVPEPSTFALVFGGVGLLAVLRLRRSKVVG